MLRCTTREPSPWAGCRFEQEANEPEPRCAYCNCVEVASEGDYCSDQCLTLELEERRADTAFNEQDSVTP